MEPKQKHASYGAKVPKPNCLPLAACRQLQWRTETSRQCLRRQRHFSPCYATSRQPRWRGRCVSANVNGGFNIPPVPVAGSYFRQCLWRKQPRVAFRRSRQARNGKKFRWGSFSIIRFAEVYICKKISFGEGCQCQHVVGKNRDVAHEHVHEPSIA
jgi:hypothetical protein